jgi:molecular chaperone GrpE
MNDQPANEARPDDVEALKAALESAEQKAAESWDKALRATAELENVRRRVERDAAQAQKYALERILGELIGVADSLELALKAVSQEND